MLSVIIPTYNEEKNLPGLLESLTEEKGVDVEIIIADRPGKDKTREIAKSFGCRITDGGSPAEGRNQGAKIAKGDVLLFLDGDVKLPPEFLSRSIADFESRKLDIASYHLYPIKGNLKLNRFSIDLLYNRPQNLLKRKFPMGAMGIMVRKDIFDKIGGFDTSIKLAEDMYFVQQAAELGRFGIIKDVPIFMPTRRFDKDGYFRTGLKYLMCGIHMLFKGPVRSGKIFEYKFNHYDNNKKNNKG
jgi:glycosyltransferase involved in cell wall biosynthesis